MTKYLTTAELAERYRVTVQTVQRWRTNGYGPKGVKIAHRLLYPEEEVVRFDERLSEGVA